MTAGRGAITATEVEGRKRRPVSTAPGKRIPDHASRFRLWAGGLRLNQGTLIEVEASAIPTSAERSADCWYHGEEEMGDVKV